MLALLFFATTINYLDRIVLSFLAPEIRKDIHMPDEVYGYVTGAFSFAYMIGFLFAGKFIDRFGTRIGYAVSVAWWSVAAALHSLVGSAFSLGFWRAMLGLSESGNFPAAIKSVAEWFPKKDRAFATGIFNAGANVANMVGPLALPFLNARFGWRHCFFLTAALGFLWLIGWLASYRPPEKHPRISRAELAYIRSDTAEEPAGRIPWRRALLYRETWGFAIAKFLTDPVWWFYLWWFNLYLADIRKLTTVERGWATFFVYLMADIGSVLGGWISGFLIRRGWRSGRARKLAMALCAAVMPISVMSVFAPSAVAAVALVSLATAGHQGWSANLFTTTSDVFPKRAVGSVVGIGGCAGALGGVLFSSVIPGLVIAHFGYKPVFLAMGCFHLTALFIVHKLMGSMEPVSVPEADLARP